MRLYLNCESNHVTDTKKEYLLRAAERLRLDVAPWTPQIGADAEYILNIEPYLFKKGSKWTGIWEIDVLLDRQQMGPDWPQADRVFLAVSTLPERLKKDQDKCRVMFQACDPQIHKRQPNIKVEYDVTFAGAMHDPVYAERRRIYDLLKTFCNFKSFDNEKPIHEYVKYMSAAEVQFIRSMKTPIGEGELAQRFFESLAIGPVLTNYCDDLKQINLEHEVDYFYYRDDKDMIEKLSYLIHHPDFANKMAINGRRKALAYHTYEARLIQVFNQIQEDLCSQ